MKDCFLSRICKEKELSQCVCVCVGNKIYTCFII